MNRSDTRRVFLVIRADRTMRLLKCPRTVLFPETWRPSLHEDEVAVAIDVDFPTGWGRLLNGAITVKVPDTLPVVASSGDAVSGGTPLTAKVLDPGRTRLEVSP